MLLVMVCAFSKWIEAVPLSTKASSTVADVFHREIVCRFGLPAVVRSDRGTEF